MQLGSRHPAARADPIDHYGLRRLVREAALSCVRHVRLRTMVVIVQRQGHPRMASFGNSGVSRLEVGIAESRAFQALMRGEAEQRDPRVLIVPFPDRRPGAAGLARYETIESIDDHTRASLVIEALRLASTIEMADALLIGDCRLSPDRPAAALIAEDGAVVSVNRLFAALAPGAELLDELGTTMRDRDALRRVLDASFVSGGTAREDTLRVGPAARRVRVRCAAPTARSALVMIADATQVTRRPDVAPTQTRLLNAIIDRTTLRPLQGNDEGVRFFERLLARMSSDDQLDLLAHIVDLEGEPTWIGPFALAGNGEVEIVAVAAGYHGVPAVLALAAH